MLFIFYKTPDQLGPQKNDMNEKGILWGRGEKQKQVVFPTEIEEKKNVTFHCQLGVGLLY